MLSRQALASSAKGAVWVGGRGGILSCGDVEPNPGPPRRAANRWQSYHVDTVRMPDHRQATPAVASAAARTAPDDDLLKFTSPTLLISRMMCLGAAAIFETEAEMYVERELALRRLYVCKSITCKLDTTCDRLTFNTSEALEQHYAAQHNGTFPATVTSRFGSPIAAGAAVLAAIARFYKNKHASPAWDGSRPFDSLRRRGVSEAALQLLASKNLTEFIGRCIPPIVMPIDAFWDVIGNVRVAEAETEGDLPRQGGLPATQYTTDEPLTGPALAEFVRSVRSTHEAVCIPVDVEILSMPPHPWGSRGVLALVERAPTAAPNVFHIRVWRARGRDWVCEDEGRVDGKSFPKLPMRLAAVATLTQPSVGCGGGGATAAALVTTSVGVQPPVALRMVPFVSFLTTGRGSIVDGADVEAFLARSAVQTMPRRVQQAISTES